MKGFIDIFHDKKLCDTIGRFLMCLLANVRGCVCTLAGMDLGGWELCSPSQAAYSYVGHEALPTCTYVCSASVTCYVQFYVTLNADMQSPKEPSDTASPSMSMLSLHSAGTATPGHMMQSMGPTPYPLPNAGTFVPPVYSHSVKSGTCYLSFPTSVNTHNCTLLA